MVDVYPFTNEQRDTMPSFSERLRWFCKSLEDEFGKTVEHMQNRQAQMEQTKHYQPRVVVDDEEGDESDDM